MARATYKLPEDFLLKVSTLAEKTDEIIPKVLKEGGEVVKAKVKSNLQAVIGNDTKLPSRSTGELIDALGVSPAGINRNGDYDVKVGFDEPRSDGESNAKLANILEYGKSGQPAKPFLKPAKTASRNACIETMKRKLDEEISKI
ncbi:HK97-gp10 family putative phage morphogenesis protein [Clostridiisalibacter paucivorans]|jgi:HK97 gp10 family phage protein|uniref:HK97-gp10 family putative phage morphogenesis protein n=1 Tax=Clostridiisalibacter paucivorans TaxID=408753 RepID=UPI00047B8FB7|nr:HK97-gp10 family putative phage morphogenesis protein [Clostridiisalibacter paucivorans]